MQKKMYCLTCKKEIGVKKVVAECHKEIIYELICEHEIHWWKR